MKMENFGSILSFAAELEAADNGFYLEAASNSACAAHKDMLEQFATDEKKHNKKMLRTRQENVTEMILEQIENFSKEPFISDRAGVSEMSLEAVLKKAEELENKAIDFYTQAAEKLKAISEVARILNRTAAKRAVHKEKFAQIG